MTPNPLNIETINDLKQWLEPLKRRNKNVIEIKEDEGEGFPDNYEFRFRFNLYTDNYIYSISAVERDKEKKSYLGCTVRTRKPRAGEDWNRGNDLADGELGFPTWLMILNDIVAYELVSLAEKVESVPVEENEITTS